MNEAPLEPEVHVPQTVGVSLRLRMHLYAFAWATAFGALLFMWGGHPAFPWLLAVMCLFPVGLFGLAIPDGVGGPALGCALVVLSFAIYIGHAILYFRSKRRGTTWILYGSLIVLLSLNYGGCRQQVSSSFGPGDIPPEQITGLPRSATDITARHSGPSVNGDGSRLMTYRCSEDDLREIKSRYWHYDHWVPGLNNRNREILREMDSLKFPKNLYPQEHSGSLESLDFPPGTHIEGPYLIIDTKERRVWLLTVQT